MGYTTDFDGKFDLDKPLTPEHRAYLEAFARTRRMQRNAVITATMPDPIRESVAFLSVSRAGTLWDQPKTTGKTAHPM